MKTDSIKIIAAGLLAVGLLALGLCVRSGLVSITSSQRTEIGRAHV